MCVTPNFAVGHCHIRCAFVSVGNSISAAGATELAAALKMDTAVKVIDLSCMFVG